MIHDTVNDGLGLVLPLQTHDKFTAGYPTGKQSYYNMHTCPYMHTYLHINSLTHHSLMITNRDVAINWNYQMSEELLEPTENMSASN